MPADLIIIDGAQIRAARYALGLNQKELGAAVGVCGKYIGRIERGQQTGSPRLLRRIADHLGVDPASFISIAPRAAA